MQNEVSMPSEVIYFLDCFRTEFVFEKICYDVLIGVPDGETENTEGDFVFSVPFIREIVKSYLLADISGPFTNSPKSVVQGQTSSVCMHRITTTFKGSSLNSTRIFGQPVQMRNNASVPKEQMRTDCSQSPRPTPRIFL